MQSPLADSDPELSNPKIRRSIRTQLPYRRSNASLTNLYAATTPVSTPPRVQSPSNESATVTPSASAINGSIFSPTGSTIRSPSPALSSKPIVAGQETKDIILRAFSPHVSILASEDTEELIRHKGIHGGLLELLRPFGNHVPGKVTIRDSTGASRSWEDFAIRFVGVKDGLENPRASTPNDRTSVDSSSARNGDQSQPRAPMVSEYKPARLRTGGDVPQVEELVERHLTFSEEQSGPFQQPDYLNFKEASANTTSPTDPSPFYLLYLRRLLSGLPLVPSETLSHPIASIIAISSRSQSPIEDLRTLYASSNTGSHRLPHWVHNEFLRYYVLIHDEDYDDMNKSMQLYEQMKRHFGLHCHLLRLRTVPAVSDSVDEVVRLGTGMEWMAAAEELAEITRLENLEEEDDANPNDDRGEETHTVLQPYVFETDATNIRAFVREMVTQSLIPSMERASATWNDSVASRRRGLSGRFMSLSKRFTTFGGSGSYTNRTSSVPSLTSGSTGNYDSLQGFYRPDAPEATMRRLADYSMMLRDWKLAQSTFEILGQDFKTDKAWRYYAAANEMAAVATLMAGGGAKEPKIRVDAVDQLLETAYYSYITRASAPYYALRTLLLAVELLKLRGGGVGLEAAAKWAEKILDDRLTGPVGAVLVMERIASCYSERKNALTAEKSGEKQRKAAFWNVMACDAWLRLEKGTRAESCLEQATKLYGGQVAMPSVTSFLHELRHAIELNRSGPQHIDSADLLAANEAEVETLQTESVALLPGRRPSLGGSSITGSIHRKSMSGNIVTLAQLQTPVAPRTSADPLGVGVPPEKQQAPPPSAGAAGMTLSPHAEELSTPSSPSFRPGMSMTLPRGGAVSIEKRDPRDDGFE